MVIHTLLCNIITINLKCCQCYFDRSQKMNIRRKRARKEQQSFKVFTSDFNPKIWFNKSPKFVDRSKQTMYCVNVRGY